MGTRSDIIVHRRNGTWARIYCHWDGQIEHNGRILFEHYSDQDKAEALVAHGDISSLGEEIGDKHDFDWRMALLKKHPNGRHTDDPEYQRLDRMCNFYGRDRGETGVDASVGDSLDTVWPGNDCGAEFTYVFDDGKWSVGDPDNGPQTLVALCDVLGGKGDAPRTAIKAFGGNFVIGHR